MSKKEREEKLEVIRDEVERALQQAERVWALKHGLTDSSIFNREDLGIKRMITIQQASDNGIVGQDIQKAIDKVGYKQPPNEAKTYVSKVLSEGFYEYLKLRQLLGVPKDSFSIGTLKGGHLLSDCVGLVNPGGLVWVKEGTYLSDNIAVPQDVGLEGTGTGTVLKPSSSLTYHLLSNKVIDGSLPLDENITIRNLKIDMSTSPSIYFRAMNFTNVTNLLVENTKIINNTDFAIIGEAVRNSKFLNNVFVNTGIAIGIKNKLNHQSSEDVLVAFNHAYDLTIDCATYFAQDVTTYGIRRIQFIGNTKKNTTAPGGQGGIDLEDGVYDSLIIGNIIQGGYSGISLVGNLYNVQNNLISGNKVSNCTDGILLYGTHVNYSTIIGNDVKNNTQGITKAGSYDEKAVVEVINDNVGGRSHINSNLITGIEIAKIGSQQWHECFVANVAEVTGLNAQAFLGRFSSAYPDQPLLRAVDGQTGVHTMTLCASGLFQTVMKFGMQVRALSAYPCDSAGELINGAGGNIGNDSNYWALIRGALIFGDTIKGTAYLSADETAGVTGDVPVAKVGGGTRTLHFKNGLYVGYTDS